MTVRRPTSHGGFSLLEVLFAVMVLGIGFIMAAALFPFAIRQTQANQEQSTATNVTQAAMKVIEYSHKDPTNLSLPEFLLPTDYAVSSPAMQKAYVMPFRATDGNTSTAPYPPTTYNLFPSPAVDVTPDPRLWPAIRGNVVLPEDPRTAWVPLYSRRSSDNFAQVYIFVLQSRVNPLYDPVNDVFRHGSGGAINDTASTPATLEVRSLSGVTITQHTTPGAADIISFPNAQNFQSSSGGTGDDNRHAIGPGAYVLIGDDQTSAHPSYCNGWILRIGNPASAAEGGPAADSTGYPTQWELAPGGDLGQTDPGPDGISGTADDVTSISPCMVYVVGRALNASGTYDGPVQDAGVFTGTIFLR